MLYIPWIGVIDKLSHVISVTPFFVDRLYTAAVEFKMLI